MTPWMIFIVGSVVLTVLFGGGLLLHRRKHTTDVEAQRGARLLLLLIWLASLSILGYIAFVFGKR